MPRTSGTRRGNGPGKGPAGGAGWGGAAKGEGQPPGNRDAGRKPGAEHAGKQSVADRLIAAGAQQLAAERWLAILNDPTHPKHAEMIAKAAERMDGAPTQRLQVLDVNPDEMTDAELEAIAARGRRAAAGPATDQD